MNWISKYKYLIKGALGKVVFTERSKTYTICNGGRITLVPKSIGDEIRNAESKLKPLPVGRQELFPGVKVKTHPIRLPESTWEEMEKPYSLTIASVLRAEGYHV
jgi:hypothetical protein